MAELNRLCYECKDKAAIFACRCIHPPVLICAECLAPHMSKSPGVQHMTSTITEADIEEAKVPKQDDFKTELKQLNKKILQSYRIQALESVENY